MTHDSIAGTTLGGLFEAFRERLERHSPAVAEKYRAELDDIGKTCEIGGAISGAGVGADEYRGQRIETILAGISARLDRLEDPFNPRWFRIGDSQRYAGGYSQDFRPMNPGGETYPKSSPNLKPSTVFDDRPVLRRATGAGNPFE